MHLVSKPCAFEYQFVGKVEQMKAESERLLKMIDRDLLDKVKVPEYHPKKSKMEDERYRELRERVDRKLVQNVLSTGYQLDYDLFGYNLQQDLDEIYN